MATQAPKGFLRQKQTIDDPKRRRSVMLAVCLALMAVVASVSGLNVAQPDLAVTFGVSHGEVLWMINVYTLTLAALLLPLGALGDRQGRKPVLLIGLVLFAAANVTAGLAPAAEFMLAARFLSGIGAAMIMPVTLSVITSTFPDGERSKAIGIWTAVAGGGGILGMYLSALLVDFANWRWLFALPVILTVFSALTTVRAIPNTRNQENHRFDRPRFDWLGALTSIGATVGFTFALHEAPELGWDSPAVLTALAIAVASTVVFIRWELHHPAPLLNVRHFRNRGLSSGSTLLLAMFGVQAGVAIVLYPFFQSVLGYSGLLATLGLMPMALLMMFASGMAPHVAGRVGPRVTMSIGVLLATAGLVMLAIWVSAAGGYLSVLPGLIAMGLGMGLAMTPSTEAITSSLPQEEQGVASALNDVTRELGAALGVALLGALTTAGYRAAVTPALSGVPDSVAEVASQGLPNAAEAAADAGPLADQVLTAAQEAFVTGWQQSMWAGVAVMGAMLIFVVLRGPTRSDSGLGKT